MRSTTFSDLKTISWEEFMTRFRTHVVPVIAVQPLATELVSVSGCQTLKDMTSRVQGREIDLEHVGEREGHASRI